MYNKSTLYTGNGILAMYLIKCHTKTMHITQYAYVLVWLKANSKY